MSLKETSLEKILQEANSTVSRTQKGRPKDGANYQPLVEVKLRLRPEVLEWVKSLGEKHYTRIRGLIQAVKECDSEPFQTKLLSEADGITKASVTGRPKAGSNYQPKVDAKIRINIEVLSWLYSMGPRPYSRINAILSVLMHEHKKVV